MRNRILHLSFYFSAVLIFVSILFRVQHWPGADELQIAAMVLQAIYFSIATYEIGRSRKAGSATKIIWLTLLYGPPLAFAMIFLGVSQTMLIITGLLYLIFGRRRFLYTKAELMGNA